MKKSVILLIFLIFFVTLSLGLFIDTKDVDSPLVGKPMPSFNLEELKTGNLVSPQYFPKNAFLINVWASWCLECTREHMLLKDIQKQGIDIIGINYKDNRSDALGWLAIYGNPYLFNIHDINGELGLEMGVYGVPETFIIDKKGIIIDKFIGAIDDKIFNNNILPKIQKANQNKF